MGVKQVNINRTNLGLNVDLWGWLLGGLPGSESPTPVDGQEKWAPSRGRKGTCSKPRDGLQWPLLSSGQGLPCVIVKRKLRHGAGRRPARLYAANGMGLGLEVGTSAYKARAAPPPPVSPHSGLLPAVRATPGCWCITGSEVCPLAPLNPGLRFPFCEVGTRGLGSLAGRTKPRTPEGCGAVGTQGALSAHNV